MARAAPLLALAVAGLVAVAPGAGHTQGILGILGGTQARSSQQRTELMRLESERMTLCNQALRAHLAGNGPAPPAMCANKADIPPSPPVVVSERRQSSTTTCRTLLGTTTCDTN